MESNFININKKGVPVCLSVHTTRMIHDINNSISIRKVWRYQRGNQTVNRERTDNTMAKRKQTKRQTIIYKTRHRMLKIEQLVLKKIIILILSLLQSIWTPKVRTPCSMGLLLYRVLLYLHFTMLIHTKYYRISGVFSRQPNFAIFFQIGGIFFSGI